jgi:hypothetical protein
MSVAAAGHVRLVTSRQFGDRSSACLHLHPHLPHAYKRTKKGLSYSSIIVLTIPAVSMQNRGEEVQQTVIIDEMRSNAVHLRQHT